MNFRIDIDTIQSIQNKAVKDVLTAYFLWYKTNFEVSSKEHLDWLNKQKTLQRRLASTGMVNMVPVSEPKANLTKQITEVLESVKPIGHPLKTDPVIEMVNGDFNVAAYIAHRLYRDEVRRRHPVTFIEHSDAVSMFFNRSMSDIEVKEVLTISPVVVYYINSDKRNMNRPITALKTRQYGYCFIVKSKGENTQWSI